MSKLVSFGNSLHVLFNLYFQLRTSSGTIAYSPSAHRYPTRPNLNTAPSHINPHPTAHEYPAADANRRLLRDFSSE